MGNGSAAITGATGFLGAHLRHGFEARGVRVLPLVHTIDGRSPAGAQPLEGAIANPCLLAGVDVVVHAVAVAYTHDVHADAYRIANADLLARTMRACADAAVPRFVLLSSAGVYGFPARLPVTEDFPFAPRTLYAAAKVEAEMRARRLARDLGLSLVIARPSLVYGPGDRRGVFQKMSAMIRAGVYRVVGSGNNVLHHMHVDDLVEGLWLTATHPHAKDDDFLLAGPETITLADLSDLLAQSVGRSLPKRHVPSVLARAVATVVDVAAHQGVVLAPREHPVNHERLDMMTLPICYGIDKARDRLQFEPRVGYREGVMRTLRGDWPALAQAGAGT